MVSKFLYRSSWHFIFSARSLLHNIENLGNLSDSEIVTYSLLFVFPARSRPHAKEIVTTILFIRTSNKRLAW